MILQDTFIGQVVDPILAMESEAQLKAAFKLMQEEGCPTEDCNAVKQCEFGTALADAYFNGSRTIDTATLKQEAERSADILLEEGCGKDEIDACFFEMLMTYADESGMHLYNVKEGTSAVRKWPTKNPQKWLVDAVSWLLSVWRDIAGLHFMMQGCILV